MPDFSVAKLKAMDGDEFINYTASFFNSWRSGVTHLTRTEMKKYEYL